MLAELVGLQEDLPAARQYSVLPLGGKLPGDLAVNGHPNRDRTGCNTGELGKIRENP